MTKNEQDYRTATIELRNILQKNPNDREARQRLGLLNLEWGHGPLAERELQRAIELGAPQEVLQFPLTEALLMQGKYQRVLDYLAPKALMSAPDQAKLLAYRGDAWLGLGKPDKAKTEYDAALQMDAACWPAKLGLAQLLMVDKHFDEARTLLEQVVAQEPDNAKAWSLQGRLFEMTNQPEQAEASYSKAIALKRLNLVERANRAIIRINADKLKEAEADLATLKAEAPGFFLTHFTEGLLALKQGRYAEAQTALETSKRVNGRFAFTDYHLGLVHLYQNHLEDADFHFSNYMKHQFGAMEPRLFLALVRLRENKTDDARNLLTPVLETQPNNALALRLMSDIEFADGDSELGFEYFNRLVKLRKPKDGKAGTMMGMDLIQGESQDKVLAELEAAKALDQNLARKTAALVLKQIHAKDFDQAGKLIGKIRSRFPNQPLADNLTGIMHLARKEPDQARTAFELALARKPGDPAITHHLAQLAVREKQPDTARQLYEKALAINPKHLSIRMGLAKLDALQGQSKALEERLTSLIKDYPTALPPRLLLASHFLGNDDPGQAEALLEAIQETYSQNSAVMTLLIEAQLENHQPQKAVATALVFAQTNPQSAKAHLLLARSYAETKDTAKARAALDQALTLDPQFLPARHAKVKLLVTENKAQEARTELDALLKAYPDNPRVLALRGWVADMQNRPADAVTAYQAVFAKRPSSKTVTDLARAEWKAGQRDQAVARLEDWIRAHPEDADVQPRLMVTELYLAKGKPEAAIEQLEALLKSQPGNVLAMNNLAWLYRQTAPDKALEMAQGAAAIAPRAPGVLDTLAMIELERGQTDKALRLLRRAVELVPKHKPTQYHLALALDKAGQRAEAVRVLKEVMADKGAFPELQEVKALFDKMTANQAGMGTLQEDP